jgi:hypothetical protein
VAIGASLAELRRERNWEMQLQIASSFSIKRRNTLNFCKKSGGFPSFSDDIQKEIDDLILLCCHLALVSILEQDNNLFRGNTSSYHWIRKSVLIHSATNDLGRGKTRLDDWREIVVRSEYTCGFCHINNFVIEFDDLPCVLVGREQDMIEIRS